MKKVTLQLFVFALLLISTLYAQVPQRFNYQGIARDAKGNPMAGQILSLKISLLPTADAPEAEYEEIQTVSTNAFGLYTLQIGNGSPTKGEMKAVKWESGNKYIRVAIDPKGGTDFADAGTTQLLSVPYALYAERAGSAKNNADRLGNVSSNATHVTGDANYLTKFTALNVIGKSQIFDNGTNVGIGTNAPASTASLHIRRTTAGQYLYLENPTASSSGSFRLYNDMAANFATFTKYGSAVPGGYTGIADKYPYANILGFGNNGGAMLNASTGNIGFAITKGGSNKLKIHIDAASERLGLGGNAAPAAPIHINNPAGAADTLKFTNSITGHSTTDGLEIRTNGNTARLINRENAGLLLGTNNTDRLTITGSGNVGIGTTTPSSLLHIASPTAEIRIQNTSMANSLWLTAPGPTWTGGIGTEGNYELPFFTNNTERLVIKSNGQLGIGTNTPHPSAAAEVNSVSQGFLPPRMSSAQRDAISSPAAGLVIFNTTSNCLNFYVGNGWNEVCGTTTQGAITSLDCNGAQNNGTLEQGTAAAGVSSILSYNGGNGNPYNGLTVNSTGVTGLTAVLAPGNFNIGQGTLNFVINGTASASGTASFAISIGGQSCTLTRTVNGITGSISALNCATASLTGSLTQAIPASGVACSISYSGGNGGIHNGETVSSTGVNGLTATLAPGSFANGLGTLNYSISGTPAAGGTASFSLNIGGQSCTLQLNVDPLAVGTWYGGGVIGYIYQPGNPGYVAGETHGIIVAPVDQSAAAQWGCNGTTILGTTQALGAGPANTSTIMAGCNATGIAAWFCGNLVLNQYTDWYLPSTSEFDAIANYNVNNFSALNNSLVANGGTAFSPARYWTSSQLSDVFLGGLNAFAFDMVGTLIDWYGKDNYYRVRAVRNF